MHGILKAYPITNFTSGYCFAAGHVPMLADPAFCDLAYAIGLASLGADEKQIWHLTKIYWYTVEFGVVREDNEMKAFGAGILSSYGEHGIASF